jgi:UDP-N-acetylmuramoyl-L-alanyl-D-glutamate--2,6-diaminopimelate ligase
LSVLVNTPEQAALWLRAHVTGNLSTDSRQVGPGDGFVAWPGAVRDGRDFVNEALAGGAAACLVEHAGIDAFAFDDHRIATCAGLKAATAPIAAAYYGDPSRHLQVVAVTGTNGKTTTTWWIAQALGKLNMRCGVVGTLGVGEPGAMEFNGLTTPDPVLLQRQFRRFADQGFAACALEASSIGIAEKRLDATHIAVSVFTNFTQDHLDYHGSMAAYWEAKRALFAWPGLRAAVLNIDDEKGAELAAGLKDSALDVWTVSISGPARLQAKNVEQSAGELCFSVFEDGEAHTVKVGTAGLYNVSNLLGVIGAMRALGVSLQDAARACCGLSSAPGRLDVVAQDGAPLVVIDYAHTPDALEKVLLALKPLARQRSGQLWCVFGCGGGRDPVKRPLMGAVAQRHCDKLVVTSDNPRAESPSAIISQILLGLADGSPAHVQADRALAISQTIAEANSADVVLLAGKGHEDHQEICGVKYPFSDRLLALAALDAKRPGAPQREGQVV